MNPTAPFDTEKDKLAIDQLTDRFFDLFTNKNGKTPNVRDIRNIFIEEGIIINNTGATPLIYDLTNFIEPREKMLTDGTLTDFAEREISHKIEVFGGVAQRFCLYEKSGNLNGKSFTSEGVKTFQFIKVGDDWKITSVAWYDE